jgi:integrase
MTKRAKTLTPDELSMLLAHIDATSTMPVRDRLMVLLSFKAGLRVAEIAKIEIDAMTTANGRVAKQILIGADVGKGGKERVLPMHPDIAIALSTFRKAYPDTKTIAISSQPFRHTRPGTKGVSKNASAPDAIKMMSVNSLTCYFRRLLIGAGFEGASSHSGRRSFATELARRSNRFHKSLKDVQMLMGHARIDTTERYLEPDDDVFDLVASL